MADPSAPADNQLTLGGRTYTLEPQRVGRIAKQLRTVQEAFGGNTSPEEATGVVYDALRVFIPDLAGEWELAGYPSKDAYADVLRHRKAQVDAYDAAEAKVRDLLREYDVDSIADLPADVKVPEYEDPEPDWEDPYDEEADRSATLPELADAVQAIYAVNGGKRLESLLGKVIDANLIKTLGRSLIVRWANRVTTPKAPALASTASPNSPPPSGESPSPNSGTTDPTPAPSPVDPSTSEPAAIPPAGTPAAS